MEMLQADIWPGSNDRVRFYQASREMGSDLMYENDLSNADLYDSEYDVFSPTYPEYYPSMSPKEANSRPELLQRFSEDNAFQATSSIPSIQSRVNSGKNT
jgi:hypothetical protein